MRIRSVQCSRLLRVVLLTALVAAAVSGGAAEPAQAQAQVDTIVKVSLSAGHSLPLTTIDPITKVAVANPEVADVVVVTERDIVINGKANGETDIVLWSGTRPRVHYRVSVRAPSDRKMVLLSVRMAEVRKDLLREIGVSGRYRSPDGSTRAATGRFNGDQLEAADGRIQLGGQSQFLSILSGFGTQQFLAYLSAEEQGGRAKLLAQPNLLASDRDTASFLAGGEFPIPVVQGGGGAGVGNNNAVTIVYREYGVRLRFTPTIVSDTIIKLLVNPEVSSLDYGNAVLLSGFRIPALLTRRVASTVDIRRDQSVILSGLFNDQREQVRTGVPFIMNIPILGMLFSSTRWQSAETELVVIVTPSVVDPSNVGEELVFPDRPRPGTPALDALGKRPPADTVKKSP